MHVLTDASAIAMAAADPVLDGAGTALGWNVSEKRSKLLFF